ncbi:hypothetical protein GB931_18035 [Modestobacter sp. I12A-02628]|uniref:Glycosyltransferase RgtA/B/C/D-like domain-containing protein n=1 Tax=Goekera deserti TaxID=2497753 RepID=A0A7K3W8A8_9ACTN|nr:hypothetical protein [Goekera deserti]MPQ99782.1 hypothetical protein [Goekera deserti]NDI49938.1 hypothetical protein [Goekera deserti]NEL52584.1 hypothetical protein [Goekera deserti]
MATDVTARPVSAPTATPTRQARGPVLLMALVGGLVGAAGIAVAHRALIDDAYITLAYARQLAEHLHWGLIPTEESNAATSPLNVALLAAATRLVALVTGEIRPVVGLGVLTVVLSALLTGWAASLSRRLGASAGWALVVLAVVLANPFVNSSLGMEVLLTATLLVGLTRAAVHGRVAGFGVLAGLLVLTRVDLGVIVAVVFLLSPQVRRWGAVAVAAVVALPWFVFSWWHFGSAIPDSFVIKTLQGSFGEATFANGLWEQWAPQSSFAVWLAVAPALLGVLLVLGMLVAGACRRLPRERWPLVGLGLGGVAYFAAYSALGVPPYQWYYVPSTVSLGVAGVLALAAPTARWRPAGARPAPITRLIPALLTVAMVALGVSVLPGSWVDWERPTFFGNWALPQQYVAIGADVGRIVGDATVEAPPEIGTLAYACECSMVDEFSDRGRTLELVQARIDEAGTVGQALLLANFTRLDRDQAPRPAEYRLVYSYDAAPPGVPSWPVSSPATGDAVLYLEPLPTAR